MQNYIAITQLTWRIFGGISERKMQYIHYRGTSIERYFPNNVSIVLLLMTESNLSQMS